MLNGFRRNKLIISSLSLSAGWRAAFGQWLEVKCELKVFNIGNRLEKAFCNAPAKRQNLNRQPWTAEEASRHTPTGQQTRRNLRNETLINLKSHQPEGRHERFTINWFLANFWFSRSLGAVGPDSSNKRRRVIDSHCVMQKAKKKLNFEWFELVFLLRLFDRIF